jgi:hypothetical protein
MTELVAQALQYFSFWQVIGLLFSLGAGLWAVAHFMAAPDTEVRVLWGMTSYHKKRHESRSGKCLTNDRPSKASGGPGDILDICDENAITLYLDDQCGEGALRLKTSGEWIQRTKQQLVQMSAFSKEALMVRLFAGVRSTITAEFRSLISLTDGLAITVDFGGEIIPIRLRNGQEIRTKGLRRGDSISVDCSFDDEFGHFLDGIYLD